MFNHIWEMVDSSNSISFWKSQLWWSQRTNGHSYGSTISSAIAEVCHPLRWRGESLLKLRVRWGGPSRPLGSLGQSCMVDLTHQPDGAGNWWTRKSICKWGTGSSKSVILPGKMMMKLIKRYRVEFFGYLILGQHGIESGGGLKRAWNDGRCRCADVWALVASALGY